jgi:hypothetical protein
MSSEILYNNNNAASARYQVLISSFSHSGTLVLEVSCTLVDVGRGAMVFTKIHALFPQQAMSASTTDGPEKLLKNVEFLPSIYITIFFTIGKACATEIIV